MKVTASTPSIPVHLIKAKKNQTPSYSSRTWKMQGSTGSSWRAWDGGVRIEEGIRQLEQCVAAALHAWPAGGVSLAGAHHAVARVAWLGGGSSRLGASNGGPSVSKITGED
jgi:hypothetical protein